MLKHGQRNERGERWDRPSMAWVSAAEWDRRDADRQESIFRRRANQGELQCPMVIRDGMDPVQSMLDGKMYDSKSKLRKTYKEGGVVEVGNDPSILDPKPRPKRKPDIKGIRDAFRRGVSLANLTTSTPGDDIRIKEWTPPPPATRLHGGVPDD